MMRVPAFRIVPVCGACISPSTVRSMTRSAACSFASTASSPVSAFDAPVDRMTGPGGAGLLGTVMVVAGTDMAASAACARCRFSRRDWLSARITTSSPALARHRPNSSTKLSCQCGSTGTSIISLSGVIT